MTSQPAPFVIAVDGPSGSGKSSVSRAVAEQLGAGYLDTGAMYRALTWWCLASEVDLDDREAIATAAVGQSGQESSLLKMTLKYSVGLLVFVCIWTFILATFVYQ